VAELGELCLWAAGPLAALAAASSIAAGWTRRGNLAVLGGRAADATAMLLLVASAGLGYALVAVQLKYTYVAAHSGFQEAPYWRLAALWSAPAGGALLITFLVAALASLSHRLERTRRSAARTGTLAALVLLGLLVLARARPFALLAVPAVEGQGLPLEVEDVTWQLQAWATYLAVACAAFVFAGSLGGQLVESSGEERRERGAVTLGAGLLTTALLAALWRDYTVEGRLLGAGGLMSVALHAPAWALAISYLHAPGGAAAPAWAVRWHRILGVAVFPAAIGAAASLLARPGAELTAPPWAAGFAVGVVSGALAGFAPARRIAEVPQPVPGHGPFALLGGLITLGVAGVVSLWGLLSGSFWQHLTWPIAFISLAGIAAWSVGRPAGTWKRAWPAAAVIAGTGVVAAYGLSGWREPEFAVAGGLAAAVLAGFAFDMIRLRAARRALAVDDPGPAAPVFRGRARRRRASALAHLGLALIVLGTSAGALNRAAAGRIEPGESLSLPDRSGEGISVTYLGLSRYRVDDLERMVASFRLDRGDAPPQIVTAALTYDFTGRRQIRTPALQRGIVRDVIIQFSSRRQSEAIDCRLSIRFLVSLVWLGGVLMLLSFAVRGRPFQ
jgi:cytochrome c-type biogenesis protein CcmF